MVVGQHVALGHHNAAAGALQHLTAVVFIVAAAVIAALATAGGWLGWRGAIVAGLGLAMSATAIALRILDDRSDLQASYGQRAFAILLFQDMSVVPLLALLLEVMMSRKVEASL